MDAAASEDIFAYIYAVLYAPSYHRRYADFLRRDFPRIPLLTNKATFQKLSALGNELIDLHLLRCIPPTLTNYPMVGSNHIDDIKFKPSRGGAENGRVCINEEQYFDNVPKAVWEYTIGGHRVAQKWLKDRKGRLLSFDELQHYGRVIGSLDQTIRIQGEIDGAMARQTSDVGKSSL